MTKSKVKLKEYIHPKMDILFVGLNAPVNSNENEHWFTHNLSFWNLLYRSKIITKPIINKLDGDVKVFGDTKININNIIIGVTDLNNEDVETNSKKVGVNSTYVDRIIKILDVKKVSKICLIHSDVGKALRKCTKINFNSNRYGLIGNYKETQIFEVPFHSSSIHNKEQFYSLLVADIIKSNN